MKTTKRLENKRKDYDDKRKKVQEQWEDLKAKESTLRENFIRFNQVQAPYGKPQNFARCSFAVCQGKPGENGARHAENQRTERAEGGAPEENGGAAEEVRRNSEHQSENGHQHRPVPHLRTVSLASG